MLSRAKHVASYRWLQDLPTRSDRLNPGHSHVAALGTGLDGLLWLGVVAERCVLQVACLWLRGSVVVEGFAASLPYNSFLLFSS
jgi:hypothetical protein